MRRAHHHLTMRSTWRRALLTALLAASCGGPSPSAPGATVGPTPSMAAPATDPGSSGAPAAAIDALLASMQGAVLAGDRAGYLALVDPSDPVFALEHGRWADEWAGPKPVAVYDLGLAGITVDGAEATGRLTVTWRLADGDESRTATFAARFTQGPGGWRYAGESWIATDAPHFRVLVAPGLEGTAAAIVAGLPEVYDHVTTTLDVAPAGSMQIKEYTDAEALVANTLLSLPPIRGWNEPGEALKLRADAEHPSQRLVIAHEFTHFALFDRAGTQRTRMPWWLDEGIASYVASAFDDPGTADRLEQVIAWEAAGELADWDDMAVFEEAPLELWRFVYPQGYAMTRFVTDEYGEAKRNAWLAAMAIEMDINQATSAKLGLTFDELDGAFRAWLVSQRPD